MKTNHRSIYQPQIAKIFKDMKIGGADRPVAKHHSQDRFEGNPGSNASREKARAAKDTGAETYREVVARMLADARENARRKAQR